MIWFDYLLYAISSFVIAYFFIKTFNKCKLFTVKLKKGQIWEYRHSDNPFKPEVVKRYKVLDVQNKYVQYQDLENNRIDSEKISMFTIKINLLTDEEQ